MRGLSALEDLEITLECGRREGSCAGCSNGWDSMMHVKEDRKTFSLDSEAAC